MGGALISGERRARWALFTCVLAWLSACGASDVRPAPARYEDEPRPRARVLRLHALDERPTSLQDLTRRKSEGGEAFAGVVLHIFTTWCRPCLEEVSKLNQLQRAAPHVKVIGVCVEGRGCPRLADFKRLTRAEYELFTGDQALVRGEGPYGMLSSVPVTFVIDAKGREVIRFDGQIPLTYATKLTAPLSPLVERPVEGGEPR